MLTFFSVQTQTYNTWLLCCEQRVSSLDGRCPNVTISFVKSGFQGLIPWKAQKRPTKVYIYQDFIGSNDNWLNILIIECAGWNFLKQRSNIFELLFICFQRKCVLAPGGCNKVRTRWFKLQNFSEAILTTEVVCFCFKIYTFNTYIFPN